ncbi:MAG TPA: acetyl-CoA hydrolase/transferase C-terminal domain-containing protein [Verrucomicrobiae bacterium]|nr:acetyl-CoA hydrolase/transferase C-terminal domain-containing protein [Verrucomicrobiae bacterium]
MPRAIGADDVLSVLPHGARVLVQGGAGESRLIAQAIEGGLAARPDLSFVGIMLPGVNTNTYGGAFTTFFLTPEFKAANARFLPLGYNEILAYLTAQRIDAALFTASPPDESGFCSFGAAVDFLADLWPRIPIRIAHINPAMPHTHGHAGIPFDDLTCVIEAETPLIEFRDAPDDEITRAIGAHVAALVPNGATVQTGIGKAPGACMRALTAKRDLRLQTGFVGEWALDLIDAGAIAPDAPITTGLALGSPRLYAALRSSQFTFRPVSYTHAPSVLATQEKFVTINAALEVDLFGQVYAERAPNGFASGPGGSLDFARGAKLAGGTRIIVLPAAAPYSVTTISTSKRLNDTGPRPAPGPTIRLESRAADLRECTHDARAERLINVAAPAHREALLASWRAATA